MLNAAIWLGAAVFYLLGAGPAAYSDDVRQLLGPRNYPFFSRAFAFAVADRFFYLQWVCSAVAALHLLAGWLYLGRLPGRFWVWLLAGLIMLNAANGALLQPRLKAWHQTQHSAQVRPEQRENAAQKNRSWQTVSTLSNLVSVAGLALYAWRMNTASDGSRFVSAGKFRG
jgi:hypothetical protein